LKFNLGFVKKATGGKIFGDELMLLDGVSIDSRKVKKGSLFVALKGEKTDGHNFLKEAYEEASAAMVSKKIDLKKPYVLVQDTLKSFHILSKNIREKINPYVFAITGSVGKSSLKNLLFQSLSKVLNNLNSSEGNLNSITGLPLTICNVDDSCKYLILEAGINKIGEMEVLSFISEPNFVCFTGVKPVHTAFLESLEKIGIEKSKILKYLKNDGFILYPFKDQYLIDQISKYPQKKLSFGMGGDIEGEILKDNGFFGFDLKIKVKEKYFEFNVPMGNLHKSTIEASFGFFYLLDLDFEKLIETIRDYKPLKGRLNLIKSKKGFYIIDDTYNASPHSLKEMLLKLKNTKAKGKKILVLGDMLELGKKEEEYHKEAGKFALNIVDTIICLGNLSKKAGEVFQKEGKEAYFIKSHKEGAEILAKILKRGDWVCFKGSRGMEVEKILKIMEEEGAL